MKIDKICLETEILLERVYMTTVETDSGCLLHLLVYRVAEREWTSLLSKALSLSINCNILKLFPQGSRHRSHHTQKVVPNVVARHQLLNTSPDNGIFPIEDMPRLMSKRSSLFNEH